MAYAEQLGKQIAGLRYENIPAPVVAKLKTCLLYGLTMAAANSNQNETSQAVKEVYNAPGVARSLLAQSGLSAADAAFADAHLMCGRGQNDTFPSVLAHPGCIVIPAVLAIAQESGASGRQVLTAMAAGYESLASIGTNIAAATVRRHFRATSVFGVFASTAAAAKLLGLTAEQVAFAIGLATQSAAGTMQCWDEGTPEWQLQVGNASRAGVVAARLAGAGYRSAALALEGESGFYRAFSGEIPLQQDWQWETANVVFKPMPGCLINQPPLYLLLSLLRHHKLDESQVRAVDVHMSPRNTAYPGIVTYGPFTTTTGAIMSGPFMMAMGLREKNIKMNDFAQHYDAGDIHALSRRIEIHADPHLSDWGCTVTLRLHDGREVAESMDDMSRFCFNWQETDMILSMVSDEWTLAGGKQRYARMKAIIQNFEDSASIDELITTLQP